MTALLVVAVLLPLGLAAASLVAALRPLVLRVAPWSTAPAAVLAAFAGAADVRWLLLGVRLDDEDRTTRGFLAFTAVVWLFAGWFARTYVAASAHRDSFWFFFLTAAGANVGVVLAHDVATFYVFYALMTFTAYGLVLHARSDEARRAGRVYLATALVAETMLLTAFVLVARDGVNIPLADVPRVLAESPDRDAILALVLAGFGVKAGAVPVHFWLPLAHPVAPAPASAVLSGSIIKAGLLGWLRFLPLGVAALPTHGLACACVGLLSAFYGAAVGSTQTNPKTVLAYSSVSQMGFATATLGAGLMDPAAADAATAAILLFATHHAFAKTSLFLGVSVAAEAGRGWPRRLVTIGLAGAALAIVGAPLSSGALAKTALTGAVAHAPIGAQLVGPALSVAAVGSTLLMLRFLGLTIPRRTEPRRSPSAGLWVPWALLLAFTVVFFFVIALRAHALRALATPSAIGAAAWPVGAGAALAWIASRAGRRGATLPKIPAGDVVVVVEAAARRAGAAVSLTQRAAAPLVRAIQPRSPRDLFSVMPFESVERGLGRFEVLAALTLLVLVLVWLTLP
ncbi:MAG: NADH dehydrogenase [Labilithrix sp.]|nr:NADH dehydrogenase [Labilithrix sp.]